jgi:hypothetical protein
VRAEKYSGPYMVEANESVDMTRSHSIECSSAGRNEKQRRKRRLRLQFIYVRITVQHTIMSMRDEREYALIDIDILLTHHG